MPTESTRPLSRQLLRVVLGTSDVTDRDLLARFVASRDEDAFAEIVRRHGPMVLAACRRVTGRPHDAEDAFQAAFLVLARRAAHLTRPELLANWLYGVACHTALEARAARRRAEEHVVSAAPEPAAPPAPDGTADLRKAIDEELAQLPDKYRTAVVLCDLEGLPRSAAATQLGIPEGTLSSRLAHARKVLAERLTRRGVTASTTAISAALGRDALATALPHTLTHTIIRAAVRFQPGGSIPPTVSPAVSSLTDGVLKTMLATRLRQTFGIGLLACGLIGVGGALAQQLRPATDPTAPPPVEADPFGAPAVQQQKPKPSEPKKVAAKGIEDDDVPYGTFPSQGVARIEEGKLIVRQRATSYLANTVTTADGQVHTYFQRKNLGVGAATYDLADVAVLDMKGNRLSPKMWKEALKNDVHALVADDGKLPNPRELTLFKPDTLLIILPYQTPAIISPLPTRTPTSALSPPAGVPPAAVPLPIRPPATTTTPRPDPLTLPPAPAPVPQPFTKPTAPDSPPLPVPTPKPPATTPPPTPELSLPAPGSQPTTQPPLPTPAAQPTVPDSSPPSLPTPVPPVPAPQLPAATPPQPDLPPAGLS